MSVSGILSMGQAVRRSVQAAGLCAIAAVVVGCASDPAPNYFNGAYYMGGDSSCLRVKAITSSRVMCYDSDGKATGYRDAMTPQEIQMWQFNQAQQNLQMQQLNQSMQQTNQAIQQQNMQYQQYQPYAAPAVTPLAPPGGNQIRCISTDIYTNCRY